MLGNYTLQVPANPNDRRKDSKDVNPIYGEQEIRIDLMRLYEESDDHIGRKGSIYHVLRRKR